LTSDLLHVQVLGVHTSLIYAIIVHVQDAITTSLSVVVHFMHGLYKARSSALTFNFLPTNGIKCYYVMYLRCTICVIH